MELDLKYTFCFKATRPDAVAPKKASPSDVGYDLVLLEKVKSFGAIEMYDTGLQVRPPHGCYFELVPRSSIIKSGYMLANGVGIIDPEYRGNVMAALVKVDRLAPDLTLPNRLVQLILRPIVSVSEVRQLDELDETIRGAGGFGSTNKQ